MVIPDLARRFATVALSWTRRHGLFVVAVLLLALLTPRLLQLEDGGSVLGGYVAMMLVIGIIVARPTTLWLVLIPTWVTMRTVAAGDYGAAGPILVLAIMVPLIVGIVGILGGIFARRGALRLVERFHPQIPQRAR